MGIGTLSIAGLEYGQSHLTDGARRDGRLSMITANGAETKAAFKRCVVRRDRRAAELEVDPAPTSEPELVDFDEWFEAMSDEYPLVDETAAQMVQAYDVDGIGADMPTSSVYGDTLEMWDADEWTQLGFSITTLR